MTRILLDTDVVSAARRLPRQEPSFRSFMTALPLEDAFVAAISIAEIRFGIQRRERRDPAFAAELLHWLEASVLPVLRRPHPFLRCGSGASLRHAPDAGGKPTMDAMIAAVALANGQAVATRNLGGVTPFGGAIVDPWAVAA